MLKRVVATTTFIVATFACSCNAPPKAPSAHTIDLRQHGYSDAHSSDRTDLGFLSNDLLVVNMQWSPPLTFHEESPGVNVAAAPDAQETVAAVFDVRTGLLLRKASLGNDSSGAPTFNVARDGRFLIRTKSSLDLYDSELRRVASFTDRPARYGFGAQLSPMGSYVLVAQQDEQGRRGAAVILDTQNLVKVQEGVSTLAQPGEEGVLDHVDRTLRYTPWRGTTIEVASTTPPCDVNGRFLNERILAVSNCHGTKVVSLDRRELYDLTPKYGYNRLATATNGARFARLFQWCGFWSSLKSLGFECAYDHAHLDVVDLASGAVIFSRQWEPTVYVDKFAISPSGSRVAILDHGTVIVWDVSNPN
jgi:hypothetical protein